MNKKALALLLALTAALTGCGIEKISNPADEINSAEANQQKAAVTEAPTEAVTTTTTTVTTGLSLPVETIETVSNETAERVGGCILADKGTPCVRAMEQYYYSDETSTKYAETLENYYNALGGNVNVYCMVIPTSQAFYTPASIAGDYKNQGEAMKETYAKFTDAKPVNIYDILNEHKNEYIYSRSDYHWQPLGAFYAAYTFAQTADVDFADFGTYTAVTRQDYLGSFYSVNNISALADFPDMFTYYKPANLDMCKFTYYNTDFTGGSEGRLFYEDNATSSSYTVFVGHDDTILEVDTNAQSDRTLVIFKDSYGNALVPFLTSSFKKIYLCDFRYFDLNAINFIQQQGATDLLFAMGAPACNDSKKVGMIASDMG